MRPLDPRLLRHARAVRGYVVLTGVVGVVTAAAVVAQAELLAGVIAGAVDRHAAGGLSAAAAWDGVRLPVLLLVLVVGVRAAAAGVQERYGRRAAARAVAQLRQGLLAHLVARGPSAVEGDRAAELTTLAARGLDGLDGYLLKYLPQLVLTCTVTPAVLAVVWWQDTLAGVTVAVTLPLVPLFMALVGLATQAQADRRLATLSRLGAQVLDLVAGLPTLRALGRDAGQAARVAQVGEAYRRATMRTLRTAFLSALVLESLTTLSVALVAVGIGLRLVYGDLDLRTGLAVLVLAPEVYLPLRMVGVHYHASVDGLAAACAAIAEMDVAAAVTGTLRAPDLRRATVVVRDVSVVHPGRATATPAHADLRIAPGEVVAVGGPSGVGKTSLVRVLLGLARPTAGRVLLTTGPAGATDEVDLDDIDPATWHAQVGWVPQHPLVVPGTLAENVALLAADVPDRATLDRVGREAGLTEVVAALPQGWDTRVGGGGHGLSAGQRQRLALARVLLRACPFVVLDEPTAHLDGGSERVVLATLAALRATGRTVLVVAHRLALVAAADRVVLLRDGPAADPVAVPDAAAAGARGVAAAAGAR